MPGARTSSSPALADAARAIRCPTRSPRRSWSCPARGVERWLTQRLSHRLGHGPGARTGSAPGSSSVTRPAWSPSCSRRRHARDDPWSPDALVWPLLRVVDATPARPGAARSAAPRSRASRARRASCGAAAATPSPSAGRPVRVVRRAAADPAHRLGDRAATPTGPGQPSTPTSPGSPSCGGCSSRRSDAPSPDERHRGALAALRDAARRTRRCRRGSRSSGTPASRSPRSSCSPRSGSTATSTSGCRTRRPRCGTRSPTCGAPSATRGRLPRTRRPPAAGVARPRRPRAAAHAATTASGVVDAGAATTAGREAAPCSAGSSTTSRQPRADPAARVLDDADRSVQVHACHGPARQVEVLREVLVGLLEDDPTLEPRDILVMCPDIETFAPLIAAAFGLGPASGRRPPGPPAAGPARRPGAQPDQPAARCRRPAARARRRSRRGEHGARPARQRPGAAPVRAHRRRPRDHHRLGGAGGRPVGLDAEHRAPYGLDGFVQNTWRFGARPAARRRRDDRRRAPLHRHALPLDDVGSTTTSTSPAGSPSWSTGSRRVDRPARRGSHPVAQWLDGLRDGVEQLTDVPPATRGSSAQVGASSRAGGRRRAARGVPGAAAVRRPRAAGASAWPAGRPAPTSAPARSPSARMVPMRSVPHRVVCLLGLDDGVFPAAARGRRRRRARPRPADRRARRPQRGPPAAARRDHGRDRAPRHHLHRRRRATGRRRPPAVPLGELLDALDRPTAAVAHAPWHPGARPRPRPRIRSSRSTPATSTPARPFSFDRPRSPGPAPPARARPVPPPRRTRPLPARAARRRRARRPGRLPPAPGPGVPAPAARGRRCPSSPTSSPTRSRSSSTASQQWASATGCSRDLRRPDATPDRRRGPSGGAASCRPGRSAGGWPQSRSTRRRARGRAGRLRHAGPAIRARWTSTSTSASGRRLTGTVTGVLRRPRRARDRTPGSGQAAAARPGSRCSRSAPPSPDALDRARGRAGERARPATRRPLPDAVAVDGAAELLRELVDLYDAGLREPLPLPAQDRPRAGHAPASRQRRRGRTRRKRRRARGRPTGSPARTPTPPTCGSGAATLRSTCSWATACPASRYAGRDHPARCPRLPSVWRPMLSGRARRCPTPFDLLRPAARPAPPCSRPAPAPARPRRSPRWSTRYVAEGVAHARRDAGRHLRPRGQPGAARAGPRPAGRGRARARRPGPRAPSPTADRSPARDRSATRRSSSAAASGSRRARRLRRRHHRHHPPVLPAGAALARRRRRHRTRRRLLSRTSTTCVVEVVDDLYLRARSSADRPAVRPTGRRAQRRPRGGRRPAGRARPDRRRRPGLAAQRPPGGASPRASAPRSTGASARLGVLTYDDLLTRLADALATTTPRRRQRMRPRWRVVLVDEFQDTDPVQWEVLDRAFTGARARWC